ncbi:TetR/AcrR family transcriptional regulator [Nocardia seriolae]|uniref:TetR/AcrR family transcriptional regulator n=1 Tax=Nocardia seriolae TaxID=37332 RepID=UPI0009FA090B|nr:TetR/AcrR family transcriptional regulator [Nocardia seriolae]PSK32884.1 TetR/AcrR family transcriptional regulator [Nocardia seriolae]WNJ62984.1 TetR/AcrR family transcriptional regulator [Nocardia seriolae]
MFIDAWLTVFATTSYAKSSISEICSVAGLSRRQFYEEFSDREDLLEAVYDDAHDAARIAVQDAMADAEEASVREIVENGLAAYIAATVSDIRRAKVVYLEVLGVSPRFEQHLLEVRNEWAQIIVSAVARRTDVHPPACGWDVAMAAFTGALNSAVHEWSTGTPRPPVESLTAMLSMLLFALLAPVPPV